MRMAKIARRVTKVFAAALAATLCSSGAADAAKVVTGAIQSDGNGYYQFDWMSDPGNRSTLDLEFQVRNGVATPASLSSMLNVNFLFARQTPPGRVPVGYPTYDEWTWDGTYNGGACGPVRTTPFHGRVYFPLCIADWTGSTPGDVHLRLTTDWGWHNISYYTPYALGRAPLSGGPRPVVAGPWPIEISFGLPWDGGPRDPNPFIAAFTITTVPEPATWGFMILGLTGLGLALRRSRRAARLLVAS